MLHSRFATLLNSTNVGEFYCITSPTSLCQYFCCFQWGFFGDMKGINSFCSWGLKSVWHVCYVFHTFCDYLGSKINLLAAIITSFQGSKSLVGDCSLLFQIQQSSAQREGDKSILCSESSAMSWYNCLSMLPWSYIEIFQKPRNLADVRAVNNIGGILQTWEILCPGQPALRLSIACASRIGVRRTILWYIGLNQW